MNFSSLLKAKFKIYAIYINAIEIVIASGDNDEKPSIEIGIYDNNNNIFFFQMVFSLLQNKCNT